MGTERKLLTYQNVQRYEAALIRHSQYCRWVRVYTCPCVNTNTHQPDFQCPVCKGRGEIYKYPTTFKIIDEPVPHDTSGKVFIKYKKYIDGSVTLWKTNTNGSHSSVALASVQPSDKSYIQLESPWVSQYDRLYANYEFNNEKTVVAENSYVIQVNVLRVSTPKINYKGREYYGSISGVTRVYNLSKTETYTVSSFAKQFIYLNSMGTYSTGDILEVDYTYQEPYQFLLHSVSTKTRYESAYVLDQSDAVLQSAYYYDIRPNDLVTSLAMELPGFSIIDPSVTGVGANDIINEVFDLARITGLVDQTGKEYNVVTAVTLIGRNEIKWNVAKPSTRYTVHYMYNPTFVGLTTYDTARFSENKSFVNRINVMMRERMTKESTF